MRPRPPYHAKRLKSALRPHRTSTPVSSKLLRRPPPAPARLGALGAACWRESAALLVHHQRLMQNDLAPLEQLCVLYQRLMTAQAVIADRGLTMEVITIEGEIIHKVRPEVLIAATAEKQYVALVQRFGLPPRFWAKTPVLALEPGLDGWEDWDVEAGVE